MKDPVNGRLANEPTAREFQGTLDQESDIPPDQIFEKNSHHDDLWVPKLGWGVQEYFNTQLPPLRRL